MSSFGRGRGILPNKYTVPPPILSAKNGISSYQKDIETVKTKPILKTLPEPISVLTSDTSSKTPNLHSFGEALISLKEDESLFPLIIDVINSPDSKVDTIERMVQIIVDRCMWLPMISRKFAVLLPFLTSHKTFGKDIKCFTFNLLQNFYEDREALLNSKKYGDNTFRNAVILTGEIYYRYRVGNSGYKIVGAALLNYLKMLAESVHEDDLLILMQQMSWSGNELRSIDKSSMNQLMSSVRLNLTVHSSLYTETSRWYLLFCLELHFQPFNTLSEEIKKFYSDNISENVFDLIKPPSLEQDNHIEYYNSIRKFFA